MNIDLDAQPETTLAGDITVAVCLLVLFLSSVGLGWYAFIAIRELVLL